MEELKNIPVKLCFHIWYLREQYVSWSSLSLLFCNILNKKKETTESWPHPISFCSAEVHVKDYYNLNHTCGVFINTILGTIRRSTLCTLRYSLQNWMNSLFFFQKKLVLVNEHSVLGIIQNQSLNSICYIWIIVSLLKKKDYVL